MSRPPNASTAAATMASQCASELGHDLGLAAELDAVRGELLEPFRIVCGDDDTSAGCGQSFCGNGAECTGRAGDDGSLAAHIEQREWVFQKIFGHDRYSCLNRHRGASGAGLRMTEHKRYFTGATATAMVQTSWPRLMISRLSFGPM